MHEYYLLFRMRFPLPQNLKVSAHLMIIAATHTIKTTTLIEHSLVTKEFNIRVFVLIKQIYIYIYYDKQGFPKISV